MHRVRHWALRLRAVHWTCSNTRGKRSISAVPLPLSAGHPSGACAGNCVRAFKQRACALNKRRCHRRRFRQHRRPSHIRRGRGQEVVGCGARMAHALLARGLRALLRAHQAAVHPWASPAHSTALAGVSPHCSGCWAVAAALPQATAVGGGQWLLPQRGCQLHTAATAAAQGGGAYIATGHLPASDAPMQGQQRQPCRTFRTTSGESQAAVVLLIGPNLRSAVVARPQLVEYTVSSGQTRS